MAMVKNMANASIILPSLTHEPTKYTKNTKGFTLQ